MVTTAFLSARGSLASPLTSGINKAFSLLTEEQLRLRRESRSFTMKGWWFEP